MKTDFIQHRKVRSSSPVVQWFKDLGGGGRHAVKNSITAYFGRRNVLLFCRPLWLLWRAFDQRFSFPDQTARAHGWVEHSWRQHSLEQRCLSADQELWVTVTAVSFRMSISRCQTACVVAVLLLYHSICVFSVFGHSFSYFDARCVGLLTNNKRTCFLTENFASCSALHTHSCLLVVGTAELHLHGPRRAGQSPCRSDGGCCYGRATTEDSKLEWVLQVHFVRR